MNDLSGSQYFFSKNKRFKTPVLRSDLCDYSDAYIVVKDSITVEGTNPANRRNKKLNFRNIAPFRPCISTINKPFIENAEDFCIVVMPIDNLLEYSGNYSMASGSFWNYNKNKVNDDAKKIAADRIC